MKKVFIFVTAVILAYITAFYTFGIKNGFDNPLFFLKNISEKKQKISDLEKGKIELEKNNYDKALKYFLKAKKNSDNNEINYYTGHTYLLKEDLQNALFYLEKAETENPEHSDTQTDLGIIEYKYNNFEKAIEKLYYATELNVENEKAYYYLSLCYEKTGKNEVALQAAETALEYDSLYADALFEAGYIALNSEYNDKAIKYFKKYLEIYPSDKYAMLNLGLAYSKNNLKDSAILIYDRIIKQHPDYSLPYNNKGYILQERGKYDEAIKLYDKALTADNQNTYPLWNRADSYFALKKYEKALNDYKKIYEIAPEQYNSLFKAGECYEKLDKKDEALKYYQKYKDIASSESKYFNKVDEKIKKLK